VDIEVGPDDAEVRLDAFLRARHRIPRSLVYKLIRQARILVGGRKVTAERRLEAGERVTVPDDVLRAAPEPAAAPPLPARRPMDAAEAARVRAAIAYEDEDVIVFDKPAGLAAHKGQGHEDGGVVELLRRWLRVPPDAPFQPSLANRLDRDTSGLVLLAKTPYGQRRLGKAVKGGHVEKEYAALVGGGVPEPAAGEVRAALKKMSVRADGGLEKMVVSSDPDALAATTRYRVLRPVAGAGGALLALEPVTGRTHQLRAHCAAIGHPIALDWKYGDAAWNRRLGAIAGLARLFLHASRIAFPHVRRPGEVVRVESPLPPDLAGPLARLER
jgi:23S rRNA pseudouridine955/2504/2580 synthase